MKLRDAINKSSSFGVLLLISLKVYLSFELNSSYFIIKTTEAHYNGKWFLVKYNICYKQRPNNVNEMKNKSFYFQPYYREYNI